MPLAHAEAVALHINRGANKSKSLFNPKNGSAGVFRKWEQADSDIYYHLKIFLKKLKKLV